MKKEFESFKNLQRIEKLDTRSALNSLNYYIYSDLDSSLKFHQLYRERLGSGFLFEGNNYKITNTEEVITYALILYEKGKN